MSREPKYSLGDVLEATELSWAKLETWRRKGIVNLDGDRLVNSRRRRNGRFSDRDIEFLKRLKAAVEKPDVREISKAIEIELSNELEDAK